MKLLLLGSNGQLGSDLVREAGSRKGIEMATLDRADLDLTDLDRIAPVLEDRAFDVLVNATGYHRTDEVESNSQQAFAVNAFAVAELARTCAARGARFVTFSSDYVFDGQGERPYREPDAIGPLNVYGASKAMGESLARQDHEDTLVFRVASLFGVAGSSGKGGNFVETMIRVGRERGRLRVVHDQVMSPTSTSDVAALVLDGLEQGLPAGTWHAVNSGSASWYQFARAIIDGAGIEAEVEPIPTCEYPTPARRPAFSVLDNARIGVALEPPRPWQEALEEYLGNRERRPDPAGS